MTGLSGARLVVTGATGQVGGAVARALAADNEVIALARFGDEARRRELEALGVRCVAVDLRRPDLAEVPTDVDHVLNFAVTKSGRWPVDLAVNGEAAGRLIAHFAGVRSFLHCSSTAVYAPNGGAPMTVGDPLGDHHHDMMPTYSISKIAGETVARFAAAHFEVPTVIARLNVPYGDDAGWPFFHLVMIEGGMAIEVHPDGSAYNPIHHDDLVAQLPSLLALADVDAPTVDWAGDDVVAIAEWAQYLGELAGHDVTIVESERALPSARIDPAPVRAALGGCSVGWREGFARIVAEHRRG